MARKLVSKRNYNRLTATEKRVLKRIARKTSTRRPRRRRRSMW